MNTGAQTRSKGFELSLDSPHVQMSSRGPAGYCHVYSTTDPLSNELLSVAFLHKHNTE